MIPQKNISKISNDLYLKNGKESKRIPETVIEKDYCLTWFLIGLANSSLKDKLVFKGGTCLRRCYFKDYRFSEDLDFTLIHKISLSELLSVIKKEIAPFITKKTGITFDVNKIEEDSQNTHQFYLNYVGPLPSTSNPKTVKVDITFKETLVTSPIKKTILKSYNEYSDFEEEYEILAYTVDEIVTEKICALIDPKRSEPRDLYDIWHLFNEQSLNDDFLPSYVIKKLESKGEIFDERRNNLTGKESKIKKTWEQRLSHQVANLPEFEGVFRDVSKYFRKYRITDFY
jgi:predicted nucleotidyltransferase component of viral defense system